MKLLLRSVALLMALFGAAYLYFQPKHATLVFYGQKQEAILVEKLILTDDALAALGTDFGKQSYFAAFAVRPDGAYHWAGGRHSPADARADAIAGCKSGGTADCVIIQEIHPKDYRADLGGITISGSATNAGIVRLLPTTGEVLFALAKDGSWAVQIAQDGTVFPQWFVLARCQNNTQKVARSVAMGANRCTLYRGPAFGVVDAAS